jgi:hypothetical protein
MEDKKLIGPIEIGLIAGIIILALGGFVYAGLAGIVAIPGLPALLADKKVSPPPIANSSPVASDTSTPSSEASPEATPSEAASPVSPSPAVSTDPTAEKSQRDEQRSKDLALIMKYVKDYAKANKGDYPTSDAFRTSWTDDASSPLVKAVVPKYATELPTDPLLKTEKRRYGYKKTDKDCEITANFENTKNPLVKLSTDPDGNQVYLMTLYCRDF